MKKIFLITLVCISLQSPGQLLAGDVHYLKARDGDSMLMEVDGHRLDVRLIGVDSPEYRQKYSENAKAFAVDWLKRGPFELEYNFDKHDRYNRLLADIWREGEMLNEELILAGWCIPAYFKPNKKHRDRLEQAGEKAKAEKAGFWVHDGLKETPLNFRHKKQ